MTFYEAAVEVLRDAGRPLHYKKIAELALARNLLSHKGRTPDQTMCDRLQQEVKKPPGDTLIVQFKPGIFALKEGVDVSEAKETMALHPPPAPDPVEADAGGAATTPEKDGRGRRRRGRKGEETTSEAAVESTESPVETSADDVLSAALSDGSADPSPGLVTDAAPEDQTVLADSDSDEGEDDDDESADTEGADNESADAGASGTPRDKRRRRRGRRGGKNRVRVEGDGEEDAAPAVVAATTGGPPAAPLGRHQDNRRSQQNPQLRQAVTSGPSGPLASGTFAAASPGELNASPLTATIIGMMQQSHDLADSLRSLSRGVSRSGSGALGRVGPAMVRSELLRSNHAAQASGRMPTFNEIKPEIWAWGTGLGSELTQSIAGYNDWLGAHMQTLKTGLAQRLIAQAPASFQTLVTLLLSRAGYQQLELVKDVPVGFAACLVGGISIGFSRTRTVFGIVDGETVPTADVVDALEALRVALNGTDAVLITRTMLGRELVEEFSSRVRLADPMELAQRMIDCEVGVRRISVSIPVFDEPMFRDAASE